jgi:hypothetical protein
MRNSSVIRREQPSAWGVLLAAVLFLLCALPVHAGDAEPDYVPPFLTPSPFPFTGSIPVGPPEIHFWFETVSDSSTYRVGDFVDVWVMVDAGPISVDALQFAVRYDPSVLELAMIGRDPRSAVEPGTTSQLELQLIAIPDQGQVLYATGWLQELPPPGKLGVLKLRLRAIGPSNPDGTSITLGAYPTANSVVATASSDRISPALPWDATELTVIVTPR